MSFAELDESKKAQLELFFELEQKNQSKCVDVCVKEKEREEELRKASHHTLA